MSQKQCKQQCFFNLATQEHTNIFPEECQDQNGDTIHVGDYVRAVRGEARLQNIEGFVEQISPYEAAGSYMTIVTATGKVLESHANPLFYEVVRK